MSNEFTLSSFREEADKKYKPLVLDVDGTLVELKNVLRLDEASKDAALTALSHVEDASGDDDDDDRSAEDLKALAKGIEDLIEAVGSEHGELLKRAINGDTVVGMNIVNKWVEVTNPGEAENSPDS